jgi:hypothetical protein
MLRERKLKERRTPATGRLQVFEAIEEASVAQPA